MNWTLPTEEAAAIAASSSMNSAVSHASQTLIFRNYRFQVLRKQKNRIASLRITPIVAEAGEE